MGSQGLDKIHNESVVPYHGGKKVRAEMLECGIMGAGRSIFFP